MARRFNLQPWREQLRLEKKKAFANTCAVVFLITAALCGAFWYLKNQQLERQVEAIGNLDKEIAALKKAEEEVKRMKALNDEVTKQILVIKDLQDSRGISLSIFDYLANNTPETVFLEDISFQQGDTRKGEMIINGVAENEMGVSNFIRVLEQFPYFKKVELDNMLKANARGRGTRYRVADDTAVRTFSIVINRGIRR